DYNETVFFNINLENIGVNIAEDVEVELFTESNLVEIIDANENFGDIDANEIVTKNQAFELAFADGIADQTVIPFALHISDAAENQWSSNYYANVNAPVLNIKYITIDDAETGNNNGMLDENETASLKFKLENLGHSASVQGSLSFSINGPATLVDNSPFVIEALNIDEFKDIAIAITLDEEVQGGTSLQINLHYVAGAYSKAISVTLPVGIQVEDWESNDLTSYDWENDATYPWFITNEAPYEGDYCLRSGAVPQSGGRSELTIITDVIAADVIKFYKKVSCEPPFWGFYYYDFLAFYIDGSMQDQWAGEIAWAEHSYPVSAGTHEFTWSYEKDNYQSQGSDCAWIDFITLPPHATSITIINETKLFKNYNLQVFPNPANDNINFYFELPEDGKISIEIYNTNGVLVKSIINERIVNQGVNSISTSVNELAEGNYFAKVSYKENIQTIKFSVVR
ncbi:MAG: T9SS type A sorting domain-containing protein, partial [Bacteroidales bacterium]|nr:T9SS type A sorting domain-containing protein [Bacteroidales bacterium]